jgi:hypothetical protein
VTTCTRRNLIGSAALALAGLGLGRRVDADARVVAQGGLSAIAKGLNPWLVGGASQALARHERSIWTRDVIGIADFGVASSVPRFHLIDLLRGSVTSLLVTHGRGSDPDHTGMLQLFSNVPG